MRFLIIEDHPLTRLGAKLMLQQVAEDVTIDEAVYLSQALQYVAAYNYDLVLMDPGLPDNNSMEGVRRIAQHCAGATLIVVSGSDVPGAMADALAAGARGFISKGLSIQEHREAVSALMGMLHQKRSLESPGRKAEPTDDGPIQVQPAGIDAGMARNELHSSRCAFSPRQRAVLQLLVAGRSNKEIGRSLGLQENTVKQHVREILRRLKVRNRTEAAIAAAPQVAEWRNAERGEQPPASD